MMLTFRALPVFFLLSLSLPSIAETRIILFGGGTGPDSSEISIEKNVAWVADILKRNGVHDFDIQFASGSLGNFDVRENKLDISALDKWLPLARVLSSKSMLKTTYRKNTVANRKQENTRDNVIELLQKRFQESKPGDDVLLIYHGHGAHVPENTSMNYLRLWGGTQLSVVALRKVLEHQPNDVIFRFILPQCYSGASLRLIHSGTGDSSIDNVNTRRCGFVTVPDDRQSEGCTVEDDETRYRDFSSYFFAAIDGKTRLGKPLPRNPDKNSNGIVDFREAYFYAVEEAYARDVPRSTSEYFLELWQPWYIRWLPFDLSKIDNEFKRLATRLAAKLGMAYSPGQDGFPEAMEADRNQVESSYRDINELLKYLKNTEEEIRAKLKKQINMKWPAATNVYAESYLVFVERDLPDLNQWLLALPDYRELAELQEKIEHLEEKLLKAERDVGMNMRLQRALHLAKLRDAIDRFGSKSDLKKYSELLQCEQWEGFINESH